MLRSELTQKMTDERVTNQEANVRSSCPATHSRSEPKAESVPETPSDFSNSFHLRTVSASLPSTTHKHSAVFTILSVCMYVCMSVCLCLSIYIYAHTVRLWHEQPNSLRKVTKLGEITFHRIQHSPPTPVDWGPQGPIFVTPLRK